MKNEKILSELSTAENIADNLASLCRELSSELKDGNISKEELENRLEMIGRNNANQFKAILANLSYEVQHGC